MPKEYRNSPHPSICSATEGWGLSQFRSAFSASRYTCSTTVPWSSPANSASLSTSMRWLSLPLSWSFIPSSSCSLRNSPGKKRLSSSSQSAASAPSPSSSWFGSCARTRKARSAPYWEFSNWFSSSYFGSARRRRLPCSWSTAMRSCPPRCEGSGSAYRQPSEVSPQSPAPISSGPSSKTTMTSPSSWLSFWPSPSSELYSPV